MQCIVKEEQANEMNTRVATKNKAHKSQRVIAKENPKMSHSLIIFLKLITKL